MAQWQPDPKVIQQEFPNESIVLYESSSKIITDERNIESKSLVEIMWFPFPRITITINYSGQSCLLINHSGQSCGLEDIELYLTELVPPYRIKVRILKHQSRVSNGINNNIIIGDLKEAVINGDIERLSSLTFHVINFSSFWFSNQSVIELDNRGNRTEIKKEGWLSFSEELIFDYENWHIVLAKIDKKDEFEKKLKLQGGYGITHICKIEHLDNANFNLDEGHEMINSLIYYLSFIRGFWIAPLLISGFDKDGNQILEDWSSLGIKADLWKPITHSWMTSESIEIVNGFPGFMKKWQDEFWKDAIQQSIQWYLESFNHVTGYNTSIVLVQTALDKLAWTYLKSANYTNNKLNKLSIRERIETLLVNVGINITPIDDNYPQINRKKCWEIENIEVCKNIAVCRNNEKCKDNKMKCKDEIKYQGKVSAITEVRNRIIHPKSDGDTLIHPSQEIIKEAFSISHDYLRECLLKLFTYSHHMYSIEIVE